MRIQLLYSFETKRTEKIIPNIMSPDLWLKPFLGLGAPHQIWLKGFCIVTALLSKLCEHRFNKIYCTSWPSAHSRRSRKIRKSSFKGSLTRYFRLLVFSCISFPLAPEYPNRAISNFYENSRKYAQLCFYRQCQ